MTKMRYTLTFILGLIMTAGCSDSHDDSSSARPDGFCVDVMLPTTPVENQGKTEFCWIYAALAAIETDRLAQGDSVSLSPLWLERWMIQVSAENSFLVGQKLSFRGILPMAMRLIEDHGMVTNDAYYMHGDSEMDSRVIGRQLNHLINTYGSQHRSLSEFQNAMSSILDDSLGFVPRLTFLYGADYDPMQFARSCYLPGEWQAFTSFSHHPYNKPFSIELKDNQWHQEALNLPIDSLVGRVEISLRHRHPVMWEGCMKKNLQEDRQSAFERHILTDDHCMCIVGMGHDARGVRYFILKNSWGVKDGDRGFRYMSFAAFRHSTILVMLKMQS